MAAQAVWMRRAIAEARKNVRRADGGPFGACIVRAGKLLAVARNTVLRDGDPTCHAEVNAIRAAARKRRTFDLSGCEIYSTTEPCPMCFSAIHWARISTVYFGTGIPDVQRRGFNELSIPNHRLKALGKSPMRLRGRFLRLECLELLRAWDAAPQKRTY
jgi:guanine deaminase